MVDDLEPLVGNTGAQLKEKDAKEHESRRRIVWAGGIRRFDMESLDFKSNDVPVIFGHGYIEWIDPDPSPDEKDRKIQADQQLKNIYTGLKLKTEGFTLTADRARIDWSGKVVDIHPMTK